MDGAFRSFWLVKYYCNSAKRTIHHHQVLRTQTLAKGAPFHVYDFNCFVSKRWVRNDPNLCPNISFPQNDTARIPSVLRPKHGCETHYTLFFK